MEKAQKELICKTVAMNHVFAEMPDELKPKDKANWYDSIVNREVCIGKYVGHEDFIPVEGLQMPLFEALQMYYSIAEDALMYAERLP